MWRLSIKLPVMILSGLALAFLGATTVCRASAGEAFHAGVEAYQSGRFVDAAQAFRESVANEGRCRRR